MIERLYQPDYSCIFGKKFSNAFQYGNIDSLVWPIFSDIKKSNKLDYLLDKRNLQGRNYFYVRKVSLDDFKIEMNCASIDFALLQAMDLGREYGIPNIDVLNSIKKSPDIFKAILSYSFSIDEKIEDIISDLEEKKEKFDISGLVLYPNYAKIDLVNNKNKLNKLFNYCVESNLFIKIDIGYYFFPEYYPGYVNPEIIGALASQFPENIIILSNLDISRDFKLYYPLCKYYKNLWFEITPLSFGGLTPKKAFNEIFKIKGLIQNCWNRLSVGSNTPTLEISQMIRGFEESMNDYSFSQQCILKTWIFRNLNRINDNIFRPIKNPNLEGINTILSIENESLVENDNGVDITYNIKLRSYSITQLLFLTDLISKITQKALKTFPNLKHGEILIRSYHTTTSLIINEHEFGNYLDLHFKFVELSMKDAQNAFHTVSALENRADFNSCDHNLATTYGSKQLILPIQNRQLKIGTRENFYVLVTFGPRTFNLFMKVRLIKEEN
ncbi:MAG: YjbQ family protein [Candidatus Lokiarchaeota archaeon]